MENTNVISDIHSELAARFADDRRAVDAAIDAAFTAVEALPRDLQAGALEALVKDVEIFEAATRVLLFEITPF